MQPSAPAAPSRDSALGYRPALDGIRAIAVLAVIAYHFGYPRAQGGFFGVDIFFVLSGYLITSLLLAEHARNGTINLVAFWYRRAKRLLPALLLVLVVVALWVGANASPFELSMRRDDLFWTLFYGANWHFIASGQDYFAQFASASPLRHTWSLAIEEQFYLVWPVLIAIALWLGRRRPAVVAGLCIAGIAASAIAMALLYDPGDPSRAYYGTDARMHELLVGALLAVLVREYSGRSLLVAARRAAPVVAVAAGLVLLGAFTLLSDAAPLYYQGLSLVLSVVAAALVWGVETAPRSLPARLISLRPLAWVGKISYGLYLWHWPVILFVNSTAGPFGLLPGSFGLNGERLALTFAAATTSFYLLEQPIRRGVVPVIGPSIRRFAIACLVAIIAVAGTSYWQTSAAAPEINGIQVIPLDCDYTPCVRIQGPAGAPVVAVIGDSIAQSLDPAFLLLAQEHGWTYVVQAAGGCRVTHLLSSLNGLVSPANQKCHDSTQEAQRKIVAKWHPTLIVDVDVVDTQEITDANGQVQLRGTPGHLSAVENALTDVARNLTADGARFVIMELPPLLRIDCGKPSMSSAAACNVNVATDSVYPPYNAIFRRIAASVPRVSTISITDSICPNQVCRPNVDGRLVRYDGEHYSPPTAKWLAPIIYRQLVAVGVFK
jgi:peptidoglycan/LPS O-acetylase OafA/YrhL